MFDKFRSTAEREACTFAFGARDIHGSSEHAGVKLKLWERVNTQKLPARYGHGKHCVTVFGGEREREREGEREGERERGR